MFTVLANAKSIVDKKLSKSIVLVSLDVSSHPQRFNLLGKRESMPVVYFIAEVVCFPLQIFCIIY